MELARYEEVPREVATNRGGGQGQQAARGRPLANCTARLSSVCGNAPAAVTDARGSLGIRARRISAPHRTRGFPSGRVGARFRHGGPWRRRW